MSHYSVSGYPNDPRNSVISGQPTGQQSHHDYGYSGFGPPPGVQNIPLYNVRTDYEPHGARNEINKPGLRASYQSLNPVHEEDYAQITRWQTGFWRRFPIIAVFSLLGSLACTVAGITILVLSDGKPVEEWGYGVAPSVYLAIISIVGNTLLACSLTEGLVVRFWRTAMEGCTVEELNRNWACGQSLVQALKSSWHKGGRITGFALILSIFSLLRGPLNQKASQIRTNVPYRTQGKMQVSIAPELPNGYTGISVISRAPVIATAMMTADMTKIMSDYALNRNVTLGSAPCGHSCTATVKAFGFQTSCSSTNLTSSQGMTFDQDIFLTTIDYYNLSQSEDPRVFNSGLALNASYYTGQTIPQREMDDNGTILSTAITLENHFCVLSPGVVAYKVNIAGDSIYPDEDYEKDEFISAVNLLSPSAQGSSTTIGGFQYAANYLFASRAQWQFHGAMSSNQLNGPLANQQVKEVSQIEPTTFSDPMPVMFRAIRDIAFRTAVYAANQNSSLPEALQEVDYQGSELLTVYHTDRGFMAGAALIGLLGVLAVGATLWGWWELGRDMSLSPLELAKAFGSPLLATMGSNVSWKELPRDVAEERVRFGAKQETEIVGLPSDGAAPGVMAVDREGLVRRPVKGSVFGI